ncbi:zinc finger, CCHC-type [Artemisia annua]|uniref:Zinc finger, CCHC-type n=1 Tax=Artemisia annua TaxID=35608 RepID=A0A2U1LW74_ARTAN|nr:zinc finger, CCHC-type [Artemisia annua]
MSSYIVRPKTPFIHLLSFQKILQIPPIIPTLLQAQEIQLQPLKDNLHKAHNRMKNSSRSRLGVYLFFNRFEMAANQSVNNSIFRSFLEKEKLTGSNFLDWYQNLRIILTAEDKLTYVEHPISATHVPPTPDQQVPADVLAAHRQWVKASKDIGFLMLISMTPELQKNLEHFDAYNMLKELKTMFAQQVEQELFETVQAFHTCKHEEECLGHPMSFGLAVSMIFTSLNKDFAGFRQNYNMRCMGKTVNEVHAMLKLHKQGLPIKDATPALLAIRAGRIQKNNKNKKPLNGAQGKNRGNGQAKLAYAPKAKIPPPLKKEHPAKDTECHHCHQIGHWRRNYLSYLAELM